MIHSFNLIDQPWIPIVDARGRPREVSLRAALVEAHTFAQLGASMPHTNAALYRVLLAVLHRIFGPPDEETWAELWAAGRFDAGAVEAYLARWHGRFDLFDPQRPFFQQRHPQVAVKPVNALLFLIAGSDADTLFDHSIDTSPLTLTPAQAALALVTSQSFGLAGLCHPQLGLVYTDGPCSRGAVFFLQGGNLFESLMLNLVRYNPTTPVPWRGADDPPAWEMDDPYHGERAIPHGYLDYLTWHNRRILLIPSEQDGQTVVRQVTTAPGLTLNAAQRNPMHFYRVDEKTGYRVLRFTEGRALWRDSSALLNLYNPSAENPAALRWAQKLIADEYLPDRRLTLAAYGMSTEPGKQKVHFYRGDQFQFPDALLADEALVIALDKALDLAGSLRGQLWGALRSLAKLLLTPEADLEGSRQPDPKDMDRLMAHWEAESQYWCSLELSFYTFLDALAGDPATALAGWERSARQAVLEAFDGAAESAGDSAKAYKAAAKARTQLLAGLKKVLTPTQETP